MRQTLAVIAIVLGILIVSLVETPSEEITPSWDWSTMAYSNEPTNPKLITIWWEIDQELSPETIWSVRKTLDEFVVERDYNIENFNHMISIVGKRLEEYYGVTGFRVIGASIEDAI